MQKVQKKLSKPPTPYGRSLGKALDVFDLDHSKWHELAADRCAWRAMLASGTPPPAFHTQYIKGGDTSLPGGGVQLQGGGGTYVGI